MEYHSLFFLAIGTILGFFLGIGFAQKVQEQLDRLNNQKENHGDIDQNPATN